MKKNFDIHSPGTYNVIYAFKVPDDKIKYYPQYVGLIKVGYTTIALPDNFDVFTQDIQKQEWLRQQIEQSAKDRINEYTTTVQFPYEVIYTTLAIGKYDDGRLFAFDDHEVHKGLKIKGANQQIINDKENRGIEWFKTTKDEIIDIVKCIKEDQVNFKKVITPIELRQEQKDAVAFTKKVFKHDNTCLWNCKMRFGKTVTCLQLIKEMQYDRAIIITHRPVVKEGWMDDFYSIFGEQTQYKFYAKNYAHDLKDITVDTHHVVAFASMQDLRESKAVGGKYDKNQNIFDLDWDLVVIDEAHEGTHTDLGKDVTDMIVKPNTKLIELSGTPYKLLGNYKDENIYSWTYIDEQKRKYEYFEKYPYKYNPYACLPKMMIYTINLKDIIKDHLEDGEFDFTSFFKVYKTGEDETNEHPELVGKFVNEDDVRSFIKLLHNNSENSRYPFSNDEYRNYFKHTFWYLPGVDEVKAFKHLLEEDEIFKDYYIIDVAGDELKSDEALTRVKEGILLHDKTITLSCGRLTTGVTVPEWTAVFYLAGSFFTEPTTYFQTIFRVQSPCNELNGKQKETCYVFDFAPDRALRMNAVACDLDTSNNDEQNLSVEESTDRIVEHYKYCPIIAIEGGKMVEYSVEAMFDAITNIRAEKVYEDGFDNNLLYKFSSGKLTASMINKINEIGERIRKAPQGNKSKTVVINNQGFDKKDVEHISTIPAAKPETKNTDSSKSYKKNKEQCIKVLRAISIRLPLLIYGLDPKNMQISIKQFATNDAIDDASWQEFMPPGLTRDDLLDLADFYDDKVLNSAARKLLHDVEEANKCDVKNRIIKLGKIFDHFRNPDKETVLTPWWVVNKHLYDTLGGYDFINDHPKTFKENEVVEPDFTYPANYRNIPGVTENAYSWKKKLLDINAKTGLYGIYCAYSTLINKKVNDAVDNEEVAYTKIINDNIYSLCKTKMAKRIVTRTLAGDKENVIPHVLVIENMINDIKESQNIDAIANKVKDPINWEDKEGEDMHFNAIVGNPPYATLDGNQNGENTNGRATPIYHDFFELAKKLKPDYISLIFKANWITGGKGLDEFYKAFTTDKRIKSYYFFPKSTQIFTTVDIKGGLNYFLWQQDHKDNCEVHYVTEDRDDVSTIKLDEDEIFIPNPDLRKIYKKVHPQIQKAVSNIVSDSKPYGLRSDTMTKAGKYGYDEFSSSPIKNGYTIVGIIGKNRCLKFLPPDFPFKKQNSALDKYKVFIAKAYGCGAIGEAVSTPVLSTPGTLCTETFLEIGGFDNVNEAKNMIKYIKTKFFRTLVGIMKTTQNTTSETYKYVPLLDLDSTGFDPINYKIDWSKSIPEIDRQLAEAFKLDSNDVKFIEKNIQCVGDEFDVVNNDASGSTIPASDEPFDSAEEEEEDSEE